MRKAKITPEKQLLKIEHLFLRHTRSNTPLVTFDPGFMGYRNERQLHKLQGWYNLYKANYVLAYKVLQGKPKLCKIITLCLALTLKPCSI